MKNILLQIVLLLLVTFSFAQIPNIGDADVWLDGSISGSQFLDVSGNNRHFTITNKDFNDDWTVGFPYKSATTISAPIGDATLIAGDVNNFLYDIGGNPNEIPVVSFFQNIDYGDKLFCRHIEQIVDGNGVETYEPRVVDIVLYDAVRTSLNLDSCNTYYVVPIKLTLAVRWVDLLNGSDAAAGTEIAPWLGQNKANTSATVGDVVYFKTADFAMSAIWEMDEKVMSYKSIGFTKITKSPGAYISFGQTTSMEGFVLDGTDVTYPIQSFAAGNPIYKRNRFINGSVAMRNGALYGDAIFEYCVFTGQTFITQLPDNDYFNTCLIVLASDKKVTTIEQDGKDVSYINCKITARYLASNEAGFPTEKLGDILIKGGEYDVDRLIFCVSFKSLIIRGGKINSINPIYIESDVNHPLKTSLITENTIHTASVTGVIPQIQKNTTVSKNIIYQDIGSIGTSITLTPLTENCTLLIEGNVLHAIGKGTSPIVIGDPSFNIQDKNSGTIKSNLLFGSGYYNDWDDPDIAFHGISTWATTGVKKIGNFIKGWGFCFVEKGGGLDYTTNPVMYNIMENGKHIVKGVINAPFYNNTIVKTNIGECFNVLEDELANAGTSIVKNNIMIHELNTEYLIVNEDPRSSDIVSDYNIFYSGKTKPFQIQFIAGFEEYTFIEWQALGYDEHSVMLSSLAEAKALFVDYDNHDYRLIDGSIAIGRGEDLGVDYSIGLSGETVWGDGTVTPDVVYKEQNISWDIGAYVYELEPKVIIRNGNMNVINYNNKKYLIQ